MQCGAVCVCLCRNKSACGINMMGAVDVQHFIISACPCVSLLYMYIRPRLNENYIFSIQGMKNLPSPPLTIFYVFFRARDPKARVYFHICRRIFARAARVCLRRTGIYDICFYCCWHGVVVYLKFKRSVERIAVHKSIIFNPRRWW